MDKEDSVLNVRPCCPQCMSVTQLVPRLSVRKGKGKIKDILCHFFVAGRNCKAAAIFLCSEALMRVTGHNVENKKSSEPRGGRCTLLGIHCRHSFAPFPEQKPVHRYSDESHRRRLVGGWSDCG